MAVCRGVIPFQGFVGSAQSGVQFAIRSSSTTHLLPPTPTTLPADSDRVAASRLPAGVSSSAPSPAPFADKKLLPGSNTASIPPQFQQHPVAPSSSVGYVKDSRLSNSDFEAVSPEADAGSHGPNTLTGGMGGGGRSVDSNSTSAEGAGSPPSTTHDPKEHGPSPSVNTSDPANSAGLSGPHHNTSPEPLSPSPPATSLPPSAPTALSSPPAESSAPHIANPTLVSANASSHAGPLPGNASLPKPPSDPSGPLPAVHALAPSAATQAAFANSAAHDRSNISYSSPSHSMRANSHQSPTQSHNTSTPDSAPSEDNPPDRPDLAPPPAAAVQATPPGLLPAASTSQAGAMGPKGAAPGQTLPAPGPYPAALQQTHTDSSQSAEAMGPTGTPQALPGNAPPPGPALSRAAAAPGDAQTVHENTHTNNLPVIVMGALLGVALAGLLAGRVFSKLDTALNCSVHSSNSCTARCAGSRYAWLWSSTCAISHCPPCLHSPPPALHRGDSLRSLRSIWTPMGQHCLAIFCNARAAVAAPLVLCACCHEQVHVYVRIDLLKRMPQRQSLEACFKSSSWPHLPFPAT